MDIDRAYKGKDLVAKVKEFLDLYDILLYGDWVNEDLKKIQELEGQVREEMYWLREYQLGSSDVHHRRAYYEGKNSTWNAQDVEEAISPSCNVSEVETK